MSIVTPEQIELRRKAADWAEAGGVGPVVYNQDTWLSDNSDEDAVPVVQMREGACQSSACVAGMVAIMTAPAGTTIKNLVLEFPDSRQPESIGDYAASQLGFTEQQRDAVFYADPWEVPLILRYLTEHTTASRVQIDEALFEADIPEPEGYYDADESEEGILVG